MKSLFPLGQVVSTQGALAAVEPRHALECMMRHAAGDWGGALCDKDAAINRAAILSGARILSVYPVDPTAPAGAKFWIITEAVGDAGERAATTLLLPEEY